MKPQEKDRAKIILGIDPGSVVCGYGVIKTVFSVQQSAFSKKDLMPALMSTSDFSYIASGRIELSSRTPLYFRLKEIYDAFMDIIKEYSPDEVAIEKVFFAKGVKSALILGHARGAALLAAASCSLPVYEYSALEVKKAVVGYGRAEKHQVLAMVSKILRLRCRLSTDSADALALALCHINTQRFDNP